MWLLDGWRAETEVSCVVLPVMSPVVVVSTMRLSSVSVSVSASASASVSVSVSVSASASASASHLTADVRSQLQGHGCEESAYSLHPY